MRVCVLGIFIAGRAPNLLPRRGKALGHHGVRLALVKGLADALCRLLVGAVVGGRVEVAAENLPLRVYMRGSSALGGFEKGLGFL